MVGSIVPKLKSEKPLKEKRQKKRRRKMKNELPNYIEEHYADDEFLLADGFEDALMGIVESKGSASKACYDTDKCIRILMERDGMTYEDAVEFFTYNVSDAYVGERTPAFIQLRGKYKWKR